ncbi:MAG TPA: hypothetical protein VGG25_01020 [Streptosporangiaceae bacterium]
MTEPRDEITDWLGREVEPLAPPPGMFERVHATARRRKRTQGLTTAVGALVVVAGAVLVPSVATGLLGGGAGPGPAQAVAGLHVATSQPASSPPVLATRSARATAPVSEAPAGTGLSVTTSGTPPPAGFQPTSVTMISESVGAVIGQAGTPGHCGPPVATDCTSLAGTSDYGSSWYGVSAPVTGAPNGPSGVSELRFLDLNDGWAYGPELWTTTDRGVTWAQQQTFGRRVTGLETAGSRAFAVLAACTGSGTGFAADCSNFALYSSVAGGQSWQQVTLSIPASKQAGALGTPGQASSAALAIATNATDPQDGTGYLLAPSGELLSGPLDGSAWHYAGQAPCTPGDPSAGGTPLGAQLAIGAEGHLVISCDAGAGGTGPATKATGSGGPGKAASGAALTTQAKQLWTSAGGASWSLVGTGPSGGQATSLAGASGGELMLATSTGIDYSADGTTWKQAVITGGVPAGGFSYVGMTSAEQGVAVPADAALGEIDVTDDGGQTWTPSPIAS